MAVLSATAGLADVLGFLVDRRTDGLPVGDLRFADVGLDTELAAHALDQDVEVQFAHAGDDGLAGFLVGLHGERRILLGELAERGGHLLLVGNGSRLDRHRNHRIGKVHALEGDQVAAIAERIAGRGVLEADGRRDVAGADFLDLVAAVRVQLDHPAHALAPVAGGVVDLVTGTQHAGIDPEERQRTHERVGGDLERQRREGFVVVGFPFGASLAIREHAFDGFHLGRCWQIVDDRVEHGLNALVLERGTAQCRYDFICQRARPDAVADFVLGQFAVVEVLLHQLLVGLGRRLDEFLSPVLGFLHEVVGDVFHRVRKALVVLVPVDGFHQYQVDDALEFLLGSDGKLHDHRGGPQAFADLLHDA